ncbi:MAG: aspartyl/glutamyl-tRNA amidotransferase subunit C [Bacilli bacterium]
MLTKEEVLHVLNLARLEASEEEIEKYQVELKKMIDEIDKIKELDDFDDELMIAPWSHDVTLRENDSLKIEEANVLENVPRKKGNFIAVDVEVLKDE